MRNFLLLIFCSLCFASASAQNMKGKYILRTTEDGTLLFIFPLEGFKSKKMSSDLVYDMAYLSQTDSITYNFTYVSKNPAPLDSVVFANKDARQAFPANMFFIEPEKGDKWTNRASLKLYVEDMKVFSENKEPMRMLLYSKGEEYPFELSDKNWKKHTDIINKVFDIAKYNK